MSETPAKAIVLLSGGLDSATVLAMAVAEGFEVTALSFRYGQRHAIELDRAAVLAKDAGVQRHVLIDVDLGTVGGSALTDRQIDVPKHQDTSGIGVDIPITYVPARNTIFLAYGVAWAEAIGAKRIYIGVNALDYSGYPDCRPEYIAAFERLANLATKVGAEAAAAGTGPAIEVVAPLLFLTKAEIIGAGLALGVDYSKTTSCYDPDSATGRGCGQCDSCLLRAAGFAAHNLADPAV